jgi:hypothetical protein
MLAGNHDAALVDQGVRTAILDYLGLNDSAPLACSPWCIRRANLHLEHGNLYDPDNAPTHPLVEPANETEPLGVALTRKVLAPVNAFDFVHAHQLTPWAGLRRALAQGGTRTPELIVRYFAETAKIVCRARPAYFAAERELGQKRLVEFGEAQGMRLEFLSRVLDMRGIPSHHHRKTAFLRLYLDRSIATSIWWASMIFGLCTLDPLPWAFTGASLAYLLTSIARGKNREDGRLLARLQNAALVIRKLVDADAVVFGHTHVEQACPGYVNSGSFGFGGAAGRSYLLLQAPDSLVRVSADTGSVQQTLCLTRTSE